MIDYDFLFNKDHFMTATTPPLKHQEHILCVKSSVLHPVVDGLSSYQLNADDVFIGRRALLEKDEDFRQILAVSIYLHDGKVWAYHRAPSGGEDRLHGKVAVAVGGHWDLADLVSKDSIIDIEKSMELALARELEEEVVLSSNITKLYDLPKVICASDTPVDRVHAAFVSVREVDGEDLLPNEKDLEAIGFRTPEELLSGDYDIETWTRVICEILIANKK